MWGSGHGKRSDGKSKLLAKYYLGFVPTTKGGFRGRLFGSRKVNFKVDDHSHILCRRNCYESIRPHTFSIKTKLLTTVDRKGRKQIF